MASHTSFMTALRESPPARAGHKQSCAHMFWNASGATCHILLLLHPALASGQPLPSARHVSYCLKVLSIHDISKLSAMCAQGENRMDDTKPSDDHVTSGDYLQLYCCCRIEQQVNMHGLCVARLQTYKLARMRGGTSFQAASYCRMEVPSWH